jgi:hypothetical protein
MHYIILIKIKVNEWLYFLGVLFNDTVNCSGYVALMRDKWMNECMSMEHWWNDTDIRKYVEKNLSHSAILSTTNPT